MFRSKTVYSFLFLSTALLLTACSAKQETSQSAAAPIKVVSSSQVVASSSSAKATVASSAAQGAVAGTTEAGGATGEEAPEVETEESATDASDPAAAEPAAEAEAGVAELPSEDYTAPAGSPGTGTGVYVAPFPEELIGTWETPHGVRLTYQADGTVIRETYDNDGNLTYTQTSHVGNSELVGDGMYRFNDLSGDRAVIGGTGLGGGFPIEVGFQFNGDGTASTRVWQFDRDQDPATYYYKPGQGIQMTRVE